MADQGFNTCLEDGAMEAYLFSWGNRGRPLAVPVAFTYNG